MLGSIKERTEEIDLLYPERKPLTLWTLFCKVADDFPNREFIACESGVLTYAQVREKVILTGKSLLTLGVAEGDRVAVMLHTSVEFIVFTLAIAALRAIKVPMNPSLGKPELMHILNQSGAKWVIGKKPLEDMILERCTQIAKVIVVQESIHEPHRKHLSEEDFQRLSEFISNQIFLDKTDKQDENRISDIMFTSGSTSAPKGVIQTHKMLVRSAYLECLRRHTELGRRMCVPLPMFHVFGYVQGLLTTLTTAGTLVISNEKFTPEKCLNLMKQYRANDLICLSNMMERILNEGKPNASDYPDMHAVFISPSHPRWIWQGIKDGFGVEDVTTGYGLTETVGAITMTAPEESWEYRQTCHGNVKLPSCMGYPSQADADDELAIRIIDPATGKEMPEGEAGEILCRGVMVTPGYYRTPELDAKSFTNDGWFKTGDHGFIHSGHLTFIGRLDDMFKIKGEKVSPAFVSQIMENSGLINAAEIVGIEHPESGTMVIAFVELKEDTDENRAKFEQFCKDNLARFQIPARFIYGLVSDWPKTASQKINRRRLKQIALQIMICSLQTH